MTREEGVAAGSDKDAAQTGQALQEGPMRLLRAMGDIDERFVLEAEQACGNKTGTGDGKADKRGVLHFTPARLRVLAGVGVAACLVVGGLVVFGIPSPRTLPMEDKLAVQDAADTAGDAVSLQADSGATGVEPVETAVETSDGAPVGADAQTVAAEPAESEAEPVQGASARAASQSAAADASSAMTGLANPWQACADLDEACELAGFAFEVDPSAVPARADASATYVQAIAGELIEVDYFDADGASLLAVRKGIGAGDISGDYNAYNVTRTVEFAGLRVELCGSENAWSTATWQADGFSYAIVADQPLTTEQVKDIVTGVR